MEGTTLSGKTVVLPREADGQPAVLVIGFTKSAVKATRPWTEGCRSEASKKTPPDVICYDVRMVEEVPRLFRGAMERGMRSGLPATLQDRTILVYKDNDAWRQRLGVADDDLAYVVVVDRGGLVRTTAVGGAVPADLGKVLGTP